MNHESLLFPTVFKNTLSNDTPSLMNSFPRVLGMTGVLFLLLSSCSCCFAMLPLKGDQAVFEISPTVVVTNPPRFGVNFIPPPMSHWDTEPWHNQWWKAPNPNPVTARLKGVTTGGSTTTLEDNGGRGIGYYDVFRNGFFDGGTAAVYRYEDGRISLVREDKIATYEASVKGPNRITFAAPGPSVKPGDDYILTTVRTDFPSSITRTWKDAPWCIIDGLSLWPDPVAKLQYEAGVRVELSKDTPEGGGSASLALTVPKEWHGDPNVWCGERVAVGGWLHSGERKDFPRLHIGKPYTLSLWMKQTGMATGTVNVTIGSLASPSFKVTDQWHLYTADFVAGPPAGNYAERFEIQMKEPGSLLIDNITLVEKNGPPPYGFYPEIVETLKRYHPGSLRLWALQENHGFGKSLDDVLGSPELSNMTFKESDGANTTTPVGLHQMLELCAKIGADPWIITSTMFSAQEQKNLIEYLAGPAYSPYGKKRAQWGRKMPWTATFQRIKIEMGNETWNAMFQPQGFPGRGGVYGAYSEFMFQQMKSSPWFQEDKFQFVINGFAGQPGRESWAFGASALRNAPSAQAIDIAYYTGGWDAVGLLKSDNPEEGWMNILTFARRILAPLSLAFKQTADAIAEEQNRPGDVQCLVYEAGPGYTLPGPGKFNMQEQEEGKSLAQAVNSMDIFMRNLRNGYGDQAFFMFKNGHYWASHNRNWGEHIIWKALGMRNSLLAGDLITAKPKQMVTVDLPETTADVVSQSNSADKSVKSFPAVPDLPLIDCYPFRDGDRYSFMFISRRLDGDTRTTLQLPYEPRSDYTLYTLSGTGPNVNNIESEVVKVVTEQKQGMTRSFTLEIPPHSVVVMVNNSK